MLDNQPTATQNHRWSDPDAFSRSPVLNRYETTWNFTSLEPLPQSPSHSPIIYRDRDRIIQPYPINDGFEPGWYSPQMAPDLSGSTGLLPRQLSQITNHIQTHLDHDLGLDELAAIAQLSQSHFSRAFKRSTGMSPHQYVIYCRVERAKQLLKQKTMSICEVAIACGFTHQSHLNRHFKRLTGVTPKMFLKS